ncbi:MAG TPA: hypothetical protein VFQ25_10580 [Ktedonobacterales bacterium]|nr:hypothetical protein [Ktedonobacterales bacterium]
MDQHDVTGAAQSQPERTLGSTSIGIDPQAGAGLAYLSIPIAWVIVPIIFYAAEKRNRFLRFHAAQALALSVAPAALALLLAVLAIVGTLILAALGLAAVNPTTGAVSPETAGAGAAVFGTLLVIAAILYGALTLVWFIVWIWGMVAGFTGQMTSFPVIGGIADRMVGSPLAL